MVISRGSPAVFPPSISGQSRKGRVVAIVTRVVFGTMAIAQAALARSRTREALAAYRAGRRVSKRSACCTPTASPRRWPRRRPGSWGRTCRSAGTSRRKAGPGGSCGRRRCGGAGGRGVLRPGAVGRRAAGRGEVARADRRGTERREEHKGYYRTVCRRCVLLRGDRALARRRAPKLVDPCPSDTGPPSPQGLTRLSVPMIVGLLFTNWRWSRRTVHQVFQSGHDREPHQQAFLPPTASLA